MTIRLSHSKCACNKPYKTYTKVVKKLAKGYCFYHHKFLDEIEIAEKNCKKKPNTKKKCKYLDLFKSKQTYRNDTNFIHKTKRK